MDNVEVLGNASLDRLLTGRPPADEDPVGVARFAEDLRAAFVAPPAPAVEERHIAAMLDAVARRAGERLRVRNPVVAGLAALVPWKRTPAGRGALGSLGARLVAFSVAATTVTGGLAVAGALPQPVQEVVAAAAASVGIDLPAADDAVPSISAGRASAVAASLDALAVDVATSAARPHEIGLPVAEAAQACASKVLSLGQEIAASAAATTDPAAAVALAERATTVAQDAVECAVPKLVTAGAAPAPGVVVTVAPDAGAIVDAVEACVAELKPQILSLAEGAATIADPGSAATLAAKAGALAARAAECAGDVAEAAGIAFVLPDAAAVPGASAPVPTPQAPAPPETAPAAPEIPAPVALPSPVPQLPEEWPVPAVPESSAEAWTELLGSWEGFEQWMPSGTWYPAPSSEETPAS